MAEAIYIVEYSSIPYGIAVLDRLVKRSAVSVVYARPICVGKYLMILGGDVGDLRESQALVEELGTDRRISQYLLTNAHREIIAYFRKGRDAQEAIAGAQAIGIFEARNAASGIISLDKALKQSNVRLGKIWLGHFLGGKFCFILTGLVEDVRSAVEVARTGIAEKEFLGSEVIPSPDPDTLRLLLEHYEG